MPGLYEAVGHHGWTVQLRYDHSWSCTIILVCTESLKACSWCFMTVWSTLKSYLNISAHTLIWRDNILASVDADKTYIHTELAVCMWWWSPINSSVDDTIYIHIYSWSVNIRKIASMECWGVCSNHSMGDVLGLPYCCCHSCFSDQHKTPHEVCTTILYFSIINTGSSTSLPGLGSSRGEARWVCWLEATGCYYFKANACVYWLLLLLVDHLDKEHCSLAGPHSVSCCHQPGMPGIRAGMRHSHALPLVQFTVAAFTENGLSTEYPLW